jgi:hypothetical protein
LYVGAMLRDCELVQMFINGAAAVAGLAMVTWRVARVQ